MKRINCQLCGSTVREERQQRGPFLCDPCYEIEQVRMHTDGVSANVPSVAAVLGIMRQGHSQDEAVASLGGQS